jgi:hypothetical protein
MQPLESVADDPSPLMALATSGRMEAGYPRQIEVGLDGDYLRFLCTIWLTRCSEIL